MRTVWKYIVPLDGQDMALHLPIGAEVRHVATQDDVVCMWIELDPAFNCEERKFCVFGTGLVIPDGYQWRGTALMGPFVWHVFERKEL